MPVDLWTNEAVATSIVLAESLGQYKIPEECWEAIDKMARVASRSNPSESYVLFHSENGWFHGDLKCRGYVTRGTCSHVDQLQEDSP